MELSLAFKEQFLENEFKCSQSRIHQNSFFILTVALVVQSSGIYMSNPLDIEIFDKKFILIFLLGLVSIIFGYLIIKKKFPNHSDKGISFYVLSFTLGAAEFLNAVKGTIDLASWVYFLLGVNIQTGCLFLVISQIRWTHSLIVITTSHIYHWFRVIDVTNTPGAQKTAFISLAIHILLFFTLTYSNEKEVRLSFQKLRADSQQLSSFEEIIKSVIESAIVIMKDDEVAFINNASVKILDAQCKTDIHEILNKIKIVYKNRQGLDISKSLMADNYRVHQNNNHSSLYDHYKFMEFQSKFPKDDWLNEFTNLEGEIQINDEETKCFAIQIGATYWKGAISIIIIINDITSIRNHFQNLDAYKDNLLATVSHDLRTPLNGILGMLEMLHEETNDSSIKEKLQITITSAKLLLHMINDILDFSLISKGRLRLKFDKTNISALIEETTSIMVLQARMKGLKLEVENSLCGSDNFIVDNNRLRQVLLNLIGNAIKFTSEGQIKVRVREEILNEPLNQYESKSLVLKNDRTSKNDEINEEFIQNKQIFLSSMNLDRKCLIFEVEDTGIGIKAEDIGSLFKLFSRVTSREVPNMNGIGLGLAISQSLVKLMNNHRPGALINVVSEFGKGSIFRFPIYIDNEPSEIFKEAEQQSLKFPHNFEANLQHLKLLDENLATSRVDTELQILIEDKIRKKKSILVVDDDQINLLVASFCLGAHLDEFSYVTAENGKEALDKVKLFALSNKYFDVFLMDCNMPIMDGYETSQKLKLMMKDKHIPWAPIVAITANVASTDKEKCYKSGMDLYLTKPYTRSELVKIIEDAVSLRS